MVKIISSIVIGYLLLFGLYTLVVIAGSCIYGADEFKRKWEEAFKKFNINKGVTKNANNWICTNLKELSNCIFRSPQSLLVIEFIEKHLITVYLGYLVLYVLIPNTVLMVSGILICLCLLQPVRQITTPTPSTFNTNLENVLVLSLKEGPKVLVLDDTPSYMGRHIDLFDNVCYVFYLLQYNNTYHFNVRLIHNDYYRDFIVEFDVLNSEYNIRSNAANYITHKEFLKLK